MKVIQSIVTQNPCYTAGRKITVKGLMLHSVGCPQPDATVFVNAFDESSYDRACVHAFIDANTGDVYQTLPWNHRGWHAGGSANDTHIGVEMCEPNCIKYTSGASFTCSDRGKAQAMAKRTYNAAVELFAYLCERYSLDPLADGVIISHNEGGKRSIASAHVDPEHLWKGLGMSYTMDGFRKAVKTAMGQETPATDEFWRVQVGAFRNYNLADALREKLAKLGFDAFVVHVDDLYKVQVGAFRNRQYAEDLRAKLKAAGYDAFVTSGGTAATTAAAIKVGSTVRVKQGATDYNGGSLASFVYSREHVVKEINGDRVVITYNGVIVAAVHKDNLILI